MSSLGLDKIGDLSSMLSAAEPTGRPVKAAPKEQRLALKIISEDPANPREYFDREALVELAENIRARGKLISPISVRSNPEKPGHYIINHGHRRFRACRIIGRTYIEAFIDESFKDEDQIIENIHRESLHMIDVANYVGRQMSMGVKQREIADKIGKSQQYVSMFAQLLDISEPISTAVRKNVITDIFTAYELVKLEKKHRDDVEAFIKDQSVITRKDAALLREALTHKEMNQTKAEAKAGRNAGAEASGDADDVPTVEITPNPAARTPLAKPVITVVKSKRRAELILDRLPKSPQHVWIRYETGIYGEAEVPIKSLQLISIREGKA